MNRGGLRFLLFLLPAAWLALLAAPALREGLPGFVSAFPEMLAHPFSIRLCGATPICLVCAVGAAALAALLSEPDPFRGREFGSAAWGDPERIRKIYADPVPENNRILTQRMRLSLNTRRHGRNTNVLVIGGSGSGKSRSYALVNLLQCENTSYFVLDPKRELLQTAGYCLRQHASPCGNSTFWISEKASATTRFIIFGMKTTRSDLSRTCFGRQLRKAAAVPTHSGTVPPPCCLWRCFSICERTVRRRIRTFPM